MYYIEVLIKLHLFSNRFNEHMSMFHSPNVEKVMETFHGGGGVR